MKSIKHLVFAVALVGAAAASPAFANFGGGSGWGSFHHHGPSSSSSTGGSSTSGGSSSGSTPVPEPADAALFALGVAGVALGRRFRSRKKG